MECGMVNIGATRMHREEVLSVEFWVMSFRQSGANRPGKLDWEFNSIEGDPSEGIVT